MSVHFNWQHCPGTLPQCHINKATCSRWKENLAVCLQAVVCYLFLGSENCLWSILFTDKYSQTDPCWASLASEHPVSQLHWTHQELGWRYLNFSHFRFGNTISHTFGIPALKFLGWRRIGYKWTKFCLQEGVQYGPRYAAGAYALVIIMFACYMAFYIQIWSSQLEI